MRQRYFTLEEGNQLVPWLQEVFEELSPLAIQALEVEGGLQELTRHSNTNGGGGTQGLIHQKRQEVELISEQIEEALQEVLQRGIIVRRVEIGLVDFLSWREDREIYLCWVMGEPEISYWHEIDVGLAGRQSL